MLERLAASARDLVVRAQEEARALGHPAIADDHLLLALAADDGPAGQVLRDAGADRDALARRIAAGGAHTTGQVPFSPAATRTLERAVGLAGPGAAAGAGHVAQALTASATWSLTGLDPAAIGDAAGSPDPSDDRLVPSAETPPGAPRPLPPEPWFRPPG